MTRGAIHSKRKDLRTLQHGTMERPQCKESLLHTQHPAVEPRVGASAAGQSNDGRTAGPSAATAIRNRANTGAAKARTHSGAKRHPASGASSAQCKRLKCAYVDDEAGCSDGSEDESEEENDNKEQNAEEEDWPELPPVYFACGCLARTGYDKLAAHEGTDCHVGIGDAFAVRLTCGRSCISTAVTAHTETGGRSTYSAENGWYDERDQRARERWLEYSRPANRA